MPVPSRGTTPSWPPSRAPPANPPPRRELRARYSTCCQRRACGACCSSVAGGSLEAAPGQRFVDLPRFPPEHKSEALGQAEALALLRASGDALDWSYLSPPPVHLVDGEKTGAYRVRAGNAPITDTAGDSRISVADYAAAAVDDLERGTFIGQRFTAAY